MKYGFLHSNLARLGIWALSNQKISLLGWQWPPSANIGQISRLFNQWNFVKSLLYTGGGQCCPVYVRYPAAAIDFDPEPPPSNPARQLSVAGSVNAALPHCVFPFLFTFASILHDTVIMPVRVVCPSLGERSHPHVDRVARVYDWGGTGGVAGEGGAPDQPCTHWWAAHTHTRCCAPACARLTCARLNINI